MKIIDLLNKLYNMEEVPKKIKIGCSQLTLNKNKDNYIYENIDEYYGDELIHWYDLDTKVEIMEDKKIPEKIDQNDREWHYLHNTKKTTEEVADNLEHLRQKVNQIIDYLEEKE